MKQDISQKQIGQRLMELRKNKGFSQEELAKCIGLSRPSLAQIELGNRTVDVLESYLFAKVLGFSLDEFLSSDFKTNPRIKLQKKKSETSPEIRVSVPHLEVSKFSNVLLYVLERCAGKPNIGDAMLNKLLYFCDFNFYELYETHLTGARYKKLPYGPVPQKLDGIINHMIGKGQFKRVKTDFRGSPQTRYLPLKKADLQQLSAAEKTVIDHVIQLMSDWDANKISDYLYKDIPWVATKDGDFISYNLAFYREIPYSVRMYVDES